MKTPPRYLLHLLSLFCPPSRQDLKGDFLELYEYRLEELGRGRANRKFLLDLLTIIRLRWLVKEKLTLKSSIPMFNHYFKVAFRNLSRSKAYSFINILGLAVGMGVCLVIYQYISFELSYDRFHESTENIYRIKQATLRNGEELVTEVLTPHALGALAGDEIPEIEKVVRIRPMNADEGIVISNAEDDKAFLEFSVWYADGEFLNVFDFPLLHGDRASALSDLNNIVITEESAMKYFGQRNAVGKYLKVNGGSLSGNFRVSGVLQKLPDNSHLQFEFLIPLDFMLTHYGLYVRNDAWKWYNFYTYLQLRGDASPQLVAQKLDAIVELHIGKELKEANTKLIAGLQPIADVHLKSDFPTDLAKTPGSIQNIWFFATIAVFILLIAWANYVNLSTARALHRAKEVGVRKSIGAYKNHLVSQFLLESLVVNLIAASVALLLALVILPLLNEIIGKNLSFSVMVNGSFWLGYILMVLVGALIAGLYPAFVLSSFKPAFALKSASIVPSKKFNLRKGLITSQFFIAVLLISGTWMILEQITYMKGRNMGVAMDQIVVVPGPRVVLEESRETLPVKYQTFKSNLVKHHAIAAVTGTSNIPGKGDIWYGGIRKLGEPIDSEETGSAILVDANFSGAYDLEFLAGEGFADHMDSYSAAIINEEAVKVFGLGSPAEAIDERIVMTGLDTLRVQGVIKNIHWNSLHDPHVPTIFGLEHEFNAYFSIRVNPAAIPEALASIESDFKEAFPNDPFEYYFLDEAFNRQYQADLQFGKLFTAFSVLAIFISCLGLFALVSFSAALRTKEIGIRKVLGASVGNLMVLLSKEYLTLLLFAQLAAVPLIVWGGRAWLENYAFRIDLGVEFIVVPLLVLLVISLATVSYKTWTAARANPVKSLRTE